MKLVVHLVAALDKLTGNSNAATAFLRQLRARHTKPLTVIWDNSPAHRGDTVRDYLATPRLRLRLVNPHFHGGRLCPVTARTSTPTRPFGAGCVRK